MNEKYKNLTACIEKGHKMLYFIMEKYFMGCAENEGFRKDNVKYCYSEIENLLTVTNDYINAAHNEIIRMNAAEEASSGMEKGRDAI
mgnify:CR=1 FL=1